MLRATSLLAIAALAACAAHPADPDTTGGGDARTARDGGGLLAPAEVDAAGRTPGSPTCDRSPAAAAELSLDVPLATAPFAPTGHFRVQIWANAANTHTLLDPNGRGAVPMNEARFLWGDGQLYVFFYAGDLDLEAHTTKHDGPVWDDDSIALAFGDAAGDKRIIQISLTGVVADGICPADAASLSDARCDLRWESHARVGTDADGTLNKLGDNDEEWAVEAAVPLASLKLQANDAGMRIPFSVSRCEISHDGSRACGGWGDRPWGSRVLVLEGR